MAAPTRRVSQPGGPERGLTEDQIRLVDSLNTLAFNYGSALRDQRLAAPGAALDIKSAWTNYDGFRKNLAQAPHGAGETVSGFPVDSNDVKFHFLSYAGNCNPLDHWADIKAPVRFVYGGKDHNVDVGKALSLLEDYFPPTKDNYAIVVFGKHTHAFIREDEMDFFWRWIVEDELQTSTRLAIGAY